MKYTQKEARTDIRLGFAMNGNELYSLSDCDPAKFNKKLGLCDIIATGHGVYGINCALVKSEKLGYVAFPSRSTALFCVL